MYPCSWILSLVVSARSGLAQRAPGEVGDRTQQVIDQRAVRGGDEQLRGHARLELEVRVIPQRGGVDFDRGREPRLAALRIADAIRRYEGDAARQQRRVARVVGREPDARRRV